MPMARPALTVDDDTASVEVRHSTRRRKGSDGLPEVVQVSPAKLERSRSRTSRSAAAAVDGTAIDAREFERSLQSGTQVEVLWSNRLWYLGIVVNASEAAHAVTLSRTQRCGSTYVRLHDGVVYEFKSEHVRLPSIGASAHGRVRTFTAAEQAMPDPEQERRDANRRASCIAALAIREAQIAIGESVISRISFAGVLLAVTVRHLRNCGRALLLRKRLLNITSILMAAAAFAASFRFVRRQWGHGGV